MLDILNDFGNRHLFSGSDFPSISIMAKLTAHQAALCEDDIPDAWTVNGAECFDRMNISIHGDHLFYEAERLGRAPLIARYIDSWKVLLMTSNCCSFVSLIKLTA